MKTNKIIRRWLTKIIYLLIFCLTLICYSYIFFSTHSSYGRSKYKRITNRILLGSTPSVKYYSNIIKDYSLCETKPQKNFDKHSLFCPKSHIVTCGQHGRLGNQIWEYVSVWLVSKKTKLEPYVPSCFNVVLSKLFKNLPIPSFDTIRNCPIQTTFTVTRNFHGINNQSIILPPWMTHPYLLAKNMEEVRQMLRIKTELVEKSQKILHAAASLHVKFPIQTFVGVHIRRTDYFAYLQTKYNVVPNNTNNYFISAMKYFENKYPNTLFVIVSDDPYWCWGKFGYKENVYVLGKFRKTNAVTDLAIMASCNHSIIDYGTFGLWGAVLAGGETIYYKINENTSVDQLGKYLTYWHELVT